MNFHEIFWPGCDVLLARTCWILMVIQTTLYYAWVSVTAVLMEICALSVSLSQCFLLYLSLIN